ncbi:MAG: alpha/beta hydrolase [Alphaproteobacteria bacterium]|nr:alpha/beta hydrolase [Alphaproteobacteria bacterium]
MAGNLKPATRARGANFREHTISAQDGLALYVRDYGDANSERTPLLCLTGLTRNSADYHAFASARSADRRVISLDYRGRGRSGYDPDWRNYKPETYIGDIRHVLAATNCHRVVSVGTSLGAMLTMGLGVAAPSTLAGAILNDAGPELDPAGIARILEYVGDDTPVDDWDAATARVKTLFPSLPITSKEDWRALAERTFRIREDGKLVYDWDTAIVNNLRAIKELPDLWALFHALRQVPVLALRGETSDVLSPETFERMGETMANLTRVTVPGVGHVPSMEEPVAKQAIDAFLNDL